MNHFSPSFERRIGFLLALLILLVAEHYSSWQNGAFMAAVAVLGGELFLFIFGPAYAFASAPGVVEHDQSVLNIMLHPLFLAAYAVSVVLVIEVGPKALLYTAVVFALSLFVSIPRYWRADKMPEVQNKSP